MTQIADYLTKLKRAGFLRLPALTLAAQGWLRRARVARLSPFDLMALGALAAAVASAAVYLFLCAAAPVASAVADKGEWRPPVAAEPPRRARAPASLADLQTLTRPLFEKTRRRAARAGPDGAPPPSETSRAEAPPAGIALKGIVNHGRDTRVFLVTNALAEGVWLKVGETLDGWTIESAQKSEVVLRKGRRIAHLEFEYSGAPPVPGVAGGGPIAPPEPPRPLRGKRGANGPT